MGGKRKRGKEKHRRKADDGTMWERQGKRRLTIQYSIEGVSKKYSHTLSLIGQNECEYIFWGVHPLNVLVRRGVSPSVDHRSPGLLYASISLCGTHMHRVKGHGSQTTSPSLSPLSLVVCLNDPRVGRGCKSLLTAVPKALLHWRPHTYSLYIYIPVQYTYIYTHTQGIVVSTSHVFIPLNYCVPRTCFPSPGVKKQLYQ